MLIAFMALGLYQLRSAVVDNPTPPGDAGRPGRSGLIAVWLTVIAVVLFFVVDERGIGLYRLFWSHVPGFEAIRTPYRVQTILYSMAAYLVIRSIELLWLRSRRLRSGVWPRRVLVASAAILVSLIAIEMQRPIDAVIFSMISGVPTPQGFSRADPVGNPGMVGDGSSLAEWMRQQGFDGRICRVSSQSVEVVNGP